MQSKNHLYLDDNLVIGKFLKALMPDAKLAHNMTMFQDPCPERKFQNKKPADMKNAKNQLFKMEVIYSIHNI